MSFPTVVLVAQTFCARARRKALHSQGLSTKSRQEPHRGGKGITSNKLRLKQNNKQRLTKKGTWQRTHQTRPTRFDCHWGPLLVI
eukprot:4202169-Amphidinium_carterae.1